MGTPVETSSSTDLPSPATSPSNRSASPGTGKSILQWLKHNVLDLLLMGGLLAATVLMDLSDAHHRRIFPLTNWPSRDVVYPDISYPTRFVRLSIGKVLLITLLPALIYLLAQVRIRSPPDAGNAVLGHMWAIVLAAFLAQLLKQFIGGMRPDFHVLCNPDIRLARFTDKFGSNYSGVRNLFFSTDVCTQTDKRLMRYATSSFPSLRAAVAFAGFTFLFLWFNGKLKVWANYKPAFWKIFLLTATLLGPVLVAGTLALDGANHWYDLVAGALLGMLTAWAAYRASYASTFDSRFNHIPLMQPIGFHHGRPQDLDLRTPTLTRNAGWGRHNNVASMETWHKHAGPDRTKSEGPKFLSRKRKHPEPPSHEVAGRNQRANGEHVGM